MFSFYLYQIIVFHLQKCCIYLIFAMFIPHCFHLFCFYKTSTKHLSNFYKQSGHSLSAFKNPLSALTASLSALKSHLFSINTACMFL